MASIKLANATYYRAGTSGVSSVVGYESSYNRVVRYLMLAPSAGANHVALTFTGISQGNGTMPTTLRFFIGTDPKSHANAGAGSTYTGTLIRTTVSGLYTFSGSADVVLMPNTTYYVWVFPASATFGWLAWPSDTGTAEVTGGAISTLTAAAGTLDVEQILTVTRYNAGFTHTITFSIGEASGTICEKSSDLEIPWTPPLDLAYQIPNSPTGTVILTITTYSGNTQIGSPVSVAVAMAVPEALVPTVEASWVDASGAFDLMGICVKLVSKLTVDVLGRGIYGSTVTAAAMTLNGKTYAGGTITDAGELELVVSVTDSRGRYGYYRESIHVADYSVPTVSITAFRCLEDGTEDDMGEFANVSISGTTVQVNDCNTAQVTFTYGVTAEAIDVEVGAFTVTRIVPADSTKTLALAAILTDALMSSPESKMVLPIGYATMDLFKGGKGIAFGTTAKQEGFTCAMDTTFSGRVTGIPTPELDSDAVPKSYADRAKDYVTSATHNSAGYYVRSWQGGGSMFTSPRGFFNTDSPDVLAWAKAMMQSGFDGVAHFQLGYQADAPTTYCMGILVANGVDRCEVVIFGLTAFYHNQNLAGTWQGWRKITTTAI